MESRMTTRLSALRDWQGAKAHGSKQAEPRQLQEREEALQRHSSSGSWLSPIQHS